MNPLELSALTALMGRSLGNPEIGIALIDGPVAQDHVELAGARIREIPGALRGSCSRASATACAHGTFVAGILSGRRGSVAPGICPACTLLLRPIFAESPNGSDEMPSATPEELANAIIDSVQAGARLINVSAAVDPPSLKGERKLEEALNWAVARGTIVVAAAGNQGTVGSSAITRHAGVIPVAACDDQGRPLHGTNLGGSIGRRGLCAPGQNITSLGSGGSARTISGTSAAAPFVTGAIALLWSEFPRAEASQIRLAVLQAGSRRRTIAPPLLNAWAAYRALESIAARGWVAA